MTFATYRGCHRSARLRQAKKILGFCDHFRDAGLSWHDPDMRRQICCAISLFRSARWFRDPTYSAHPRKTQSHLRTVPSPEKSGLCRRCSTGEEAVFFTLSCFRETGLEDSHALLWPPIINPDSAGPRLRRVFTCSAASVHREPSQAGGKDIALGILSQQATNRVRAGHRSLRPQRVFPTIV